jgi:hypothetical protein
VDEKRFRFDLMVALLALVISGIAAGASAYQTYVIRKQFSATVWPYLTFITSSSQGKYLELDVSNVGIGPALIYSAVVTRDGKPVKRTVGLTNEPAIAVAIAPERAAANIDERKNRAHGTASMTVSTISSGDVVSAVSKLELLRVEGKYLTDRVMAHVRRFDLTLCYCSLLGDCWTKRLWDSGVQPHPTRACQNA